MRKVEAIMEKALLQVLDFYLEKIVRLQHDLLLHAKKRDKKKSSVSRKEEYLRNFVR